MLLIPCIKQADSHVNHQWSSEKHDDTQFLEHLLDVMSPHEDADCLLFRLVHATMSHPVAGKHDGTPVRASYSCPPALAPPAASHCR